MAGAGYKLFNTGDVLTAAQVNTYLQEQVVMVFNDAASRTTALSGVLAEGMVSYLKSTKVVEIYNGTAWASLDDPNAIQNTIVDAKGDLIAASAADTPARLAVGNNGDTLLADSSTSTGLKWAKPQLYLLNTTTFSAVSSQSVNDVFSADYSYYKLYISLTANSGTNAAIKLAMRVSAADTQMTSEYIEQYAGTVTGVDSTAPTTGGIFVKTHRVNGSYCRGVLDILDPYTASVQAQASGRFFGVNSSGQPFQYIPYIYQDFTTQYTGFTITASTGNISGTLRLYGVKN